MIKKLLFFLLCILFIFSNIAHSKEIEVGDGPYGIAVDNNYVYISLTYDNSVVILDIDTNEIIKTISVGDSPRGIAVTPDNNYLYVANHGDDTVSVISLSDYSITANIHVGKSPEGVVIDPDGERVYVSNEDESFISIIKTSDNTVEKELIVGKYPRGMAISPDDDLLYVVNSGDNTLSVIDTEKLSITKTISVGSSPYYVTIINDGETILVSNYGDNSISIINKDSDKVEKTVDVGKNPTDISCLTEKNYLYVINSGEKSLYILDSSEYNLLTKFPLETGSREIETTPDGKWFYISQTGSDSVVKLTTILIRINSVSREAINNNNSSTINWQADESGIYQIEINGTGEIGTGAIKETGSIDANTPKDITIDASDLTEGDGDYNIYFYLTNSEGVTGYNYTTITLDNVAPEPPTELSSSPGNQKIYLNWNKSSDDDVAGYKVYWGKEPGVYDDPSSPIDVGNITSYIIENLINDITYYIAVKSYDKAGNESDFSLEIAETPEEVYGVTDLSGEGGGCFIATAVFGSPFSKNIRVLKRFRALYLATNPLGKKFIRLYQIISPPIAKMISKNSVLKHSVLFILIPITWFLDNSIINQIGTTFAIITIWIALIIILKKDKKEKA